MTEAPSAAITLGIDVEDWYHAENLAKVCPREAWGSCESRVEGNVERLLEILDASATKATFFLLGQVAERFPKTVVEPIARAGHELASHGYDHRLLYSLSDDELREDLRRSKAIIESASGCEVAGYRAPCFSIDDRAVSMLAEEGYVYDSSLNPVHGSLRYGKLENTAFERFGTLLRAGGLFEIPMSRYPLGRLSLPVSGGGYFRLYPYALLRRWARTIIEREGAYNFYLHPWEIDCGFPRMRGLRPDLRFRHYLNLQRTEGRFRRLLSDFDFAPLRSVIPQTAS